MMTIFVAHAIEDAACAEQIRRNLETEGYETWREPTDPNAVLYPSMVENVILRSVAVVLLWSHRAEQSEWVERHLLFAQRLKKLLLPVVLDGTLLPSTLVSEVTLSSQSPCEDAAKRLLPHLPSPASTEPLFEVYEKAAHEYVRIRKEAIDLASTMLQRGERREEVLAILEYLAQNDLMPGVREKAQEVLKPSDSRDILKVRCKKGHISSFDKSEVCTAITKVPRKLTTRAEKELDELRLTCDTCGAEMVARVDCGDYK